MAIDVFARFSTIEGESQDARHAGEVDVLSWSWGLSRNAAAAPARGRRATAPTVEDFTFVHHVDKASPLLMKACAAGEHIAEVVVTVRKAGSRPVDHLVIAMSDVVVTGVATNVSAEDGTATETVMLSFGRVDLEYRPQKADGGGDAGVRFAYDPPSQQVS